jgi:hypothetical protein
MMPVSVVVPMSKDSVRCEDITLSRDGSLVLFMGRFGDCTVRCAIPRETLEQHFWLPQGASESYVLKSFLDGSQRITAAVERRLLRERREPVMLGARDFRDQSKVTLHIAA